jgi:hypothetical protein
MITVMITITVMIVVSSIVAATICAVGAFQVAIDVLDVPATAAVVSHFSAMPSAIHIPAFGTQRRAVDVDVPAGLLVRTTRSLRGSGHRQRQCRQEYENSR